MCGFAGFVDFGTTHAFDALARRQILQAMGHAMEHRGPDDETFYDDGLLSLVFRRLTIVGTEDDGQPMLNRAGTTMMVCNGEIYNHYELRRELGPRYPFSTQSDCEVVLHGYEAWGIDVTRRLRGMFAAAVWDRQTRQLFLLRDRLGIKPLYICKLPNGILFGSELKALLAHPQCPRTTDWDAINDSHPLALPNAPSFVKGIRFVPGGSWCTMGPDKPLVCKKYWNIEDHIGTAALGTQAQPYQARYDELLQASTIEHLQGQGPIGIHLSGGVDSSLLTAMVAAQGREAVCFSIVERSSLRVGDVDAARNVAKEFRLPWHPVLFDYRTLIADLQFDLTKLEETVWMMDSPLFDLEWVVKGELNRAIRTLCPELKIILLGQGADEFAGGYSRRVDAHTSNWAQYIAGEVDYSVALHRSLENQTLTQMALRMGKGMLRGLGPYHDYMLLMVRQLQQHNLWHEDRTSSAYGMEARVPFLDHRLVELLASVPEKLHQQLFWDKQIVRNCLLKRYPQYDLARPKVGFLNTDDNRSLEIIMHAMICAVGRAFREKYLEAPDFPFDKRETTEWLDKATLRAPGFYSLSMRLLSRMTAAIFHQQLQSAPSTHFKKLDAQAVSYLEVITPERWQTLNAEMRAEPLVAFPWRKNYRLRLHANTHIAFDHDDGTQLACSLMEGETTYATIGLPHSAPWMQIFMHELGQDDPQGQTVRYWLNRLDCAPIALMEFLNVLLQAGFLAMPTIEPEATDTSLGSLLVPL